MDSLQSHTFSSNHTTSKVDFFYLKHEGRLQWFEISNIQYCPIFNWIFCFFNGFASFFDVRQPLKVIDICGYVFMFLLLELAIKSIILKGVELYHKLHSILQTLVEIKLNKETIYRLL